MLQKINKMINHIFYNKLFSKPLVNWMVYNVINNSIIENFKVTPLPKGYFNCMIK